MAETSDAVKHIRESVKAQAAESGGSAVISAWNSAIDVLMARVTAEKEALARYEALDRIAYSLATPAFDGTVDALESLSRDSNALETKISQHQGEGGHDILKLLNTIQSMQHNPHRAIVAGTNYVERMAYNLSVIDRTKGNLDRSMEILGSLKI